MCMCAEFCEILRVFDSGLMDRLQWQELTVQYLSNVGCTYGSGEQLTMMLHC